MLMVEGNSDRFPNSQIKVKPKIILNKGYQIRLSGIPTVMRILAKEKTNKMIHLRLGNEFFAPPIFCSNLDQMGHIEVNSLPISNELKDLISKWDQRFQKTFNADYPPDSHFLSPELRDNHIEKGFNLAERLQIELGEGYSVEYTP